MSKKYEKRVNELIRMHLTDLLERELNDPRVTGAQVTISDVEITPDVRQAKVFYSLIGDEAQKAEVARGLESAAGWLSRELGKRLRTRHTPQLTFEFDESFERGDRLSRLLDELRGDEETKAA
ncbi:MAG: 30S ribosome-binding factor RbfA [Thermoflexales bacterium]|nr:30S ribosome-binding factor RbfA [Thermoflexales bacterium]MDW8350495.1 30S ribosome-binding factor RbfA [Anaerolineae bacterium]